MSQCHNFVVHRLNVDTMVDIMVVSNVVGWIEMLLIVTMTMRLNLAVATLLFFFFGKTLYDNIPYLIVRFVLKTVIAVR